MDLPRREARRAGQLRLGDDRRDAGRRRPRSGRELRAFYNVCKHRAHELLAGSGTTRNIVCPYHAWTYDLNGRLKAARRADRMPTFDRAEVCLDQVAVEEFGGFVYVNLEARRHRWPNRPRIWRSRSPVGTRRAELTHAKRLTYDVQTNWKNVIDNFLECYHCHIAHKEFVSLVDMNTYEVRTHGIWSSHFAEAGKHEKRPTTCPGRRSTNTPCGGSGRTRACSGIRVGATSWCSR